MKYSHHIKERRMFFNCAATCDSAHEQYHWTSTNQNVWRQFRVFCIHLQIFMHFDVHPYPRTKHCQPRCLSSSFTSSHYHVIFMHCIHLKKWEKKAAREKQQKTSLNLMKQKEKINRLLWSSNSWRILPFARYSTDRIKVEGFYYKQMENF